MVKYNTKKRQKEIENRLTQINSKIKVLRLEIQEKEKSLQLKNSELVEVSEKQDSKNIILISKEIHIFKVETENLYSELDILSKEAEDLQEELKQISETSSMTN